jgi:hypothetical protein
MVSLRTDSHAEDTWSDTIGTYFPCESHPHYTGKKKKATTPRNEVIQNATIMEFKDSHASFIKNNKTRVIMKDAQKIRRG